MLFIETLIERRRCVEFSKCKDQLTHYLFNSVNLIYMYKTTGLLQALSSAHP